MRVLVTGGYGYIGGHLVNRLVEAGHDIVILDSMLSSKPWKFPSNVVVMNDSVTNADAVSRALKGVGLIYHLAARMDYDVGYRHTMRMFSTNVMGTATLLSMARGAGVDNIVVASSAAVYGNVVEASEEGPTDPVNSYGCSKRSMEFVAKDAANLGAKLTILRFFNVWGGAYSQSVVCKIAHGHNVLYGDGNSTRDFVFIEDTVEALLQARNWEGTFNIGTGVESTVNSIYSILRPGELPAYSNPPAGLVEIDRSVADMERTFCSTKWRPSVLMPEISRERIIQLCAQ
jgi:UDP-glucose 4-epimerase